MIASDLLIEKSTIKNGTALDIFLGIEAGIVYNGETRYVNTCMISSGIRSVMASVENAKHSGDIVVTDLSGDIPVNILSADIIASDKEAQWQQK